MIKQSEMRLVLQHRARRAELAQELVVMEHLALEKREKELIGSFRDRYKAGEEVQAGRLSLSVKEIFAVSWQDVLKRLRVLPAVARLLARDDEARELLAQAETRDPAAPFVGKRVELDVVAAKPEQAVSRDPAASFVRAGG